MEETSIISIDSDSIATDNKGRKLIYLENIFLGTIPYNSNDKGAYVGIENGELFVLYQEKDKFIQCDKIEDEEDLNHIREKVLKLKKKFKNTENTGLIYSVYNKVDEEIKDIEQLHIDSIEENRKDIEFDIEVDYSDYKPETEDEIINKGIQRSNDFDYCLSELKTNIGNKDNLFRIFINSCFECRDAESICIFMKEIKNSGTDVTKLLGNIINKMSNDNMLEGKTFENKKTIFSSIFNGYKKYEEEKLTKYSKPIDKIKYSSNINYIKKKIEQNMKKNSFEKTDIDEILYSNNKNKSIGI